LTTFLLCKEFGWTPKQLQEQDAKEIEKFIFIMNEMQQLQELLKDSEPEANIILVDDERD
jgi:hypothetical protein